MRGKITIQTVKALPTDPDRDTYLWDATLTGFGVKRMPSGAASYLFKYRAGKGRSFPTRRYHIGKVGTMTPDDAREVAKDIAEKVRKGIDPMAVAKVEADYTLKDLVSDFLKSRRTKGRRSVDETERLLNREIVTPLGTRPAAAVTRSDLARIVDAIANRGAGVLANRTLAHLLTMFRWAVGRGLLNVNPIAGMEKPAAEVSRDRCPSDQELAEIWRAGEALAWPFGRALQFLVLTGLRRDEVSGLRWSELNLDKAEWVLPAKRAKNKVEHIIPLAPQAVALLRTLPKIAAPKSKKAPDLVFTTTGATPIQGWGKAKRQIDAKITEARAKVAVDAGTDPAEAPKLLPWRLHDLRRVFATGLADRGIAPHVADMLLHHVSAKRGGVAAVYNRARYLTERRAAVELWANHIDSLISGEPAKVAPIYNNLASVA